MHDEEGHGPLMAATKVARAGYPVFPVARKRKKPSVEGGFYAATTDESQIATWLEEGRKNHNVAVPTGVLSGIVVIEADDEESCAWMEKTYGLPTVKSAHEHEEGAHWYFSHPRDGKVTSRKVENVPVSLDRKGDGGYVLVPPSTSKIWFNEGQGIPEKSSLPPLPTELRGVKKSVPEDPDRAKKNGHLDPGTRRRAAELIAARVRTIEQGQRHEHLVHLCGVLLSRHLSMEDAEAILVDAWSSAAPDLAVRAPEEVPNTLNTTAAALAESSATGVPNMERITPGLYATLSRVLHWSVPVSKRVSRNGNSETNAADESPEDAGAEETLTKDRPAIVINDVQLREPGQRALAALTRVNREAWEKTDLPRYYVRGDEPVRIQYNDQHQLTISEMSFRTVQHELTHAADFWRESERKVEAVSPTRDIANYVLEAVEWSFPALAGITKIPVFRPDGSVLDSRGYDEATGLIYDPDEGFEVSVPDYPTSSDVEDALRIVDEVIGDFPYADQASLANTLALALTPILREVIDGPVPLAAIDKPAPGTGATLLVETLARVTSGSDPGALGATQDPNEMRKAITSALREGDRWLFLDNVHVELDSAPLARALTAAVWKDRILGVSKTLHVPVRVTWAATGNNLELSLEMARRSYWIRMDAHNAKPWERPQESFRHPDLKAWAREHRSEILGALLTLGRNWFAQGCPAAEKIPLMGSFESWTRTLAGVLAAAGVEGFLENSKSLYEKAATETGIWAEFLEVLNRTYGSEGVTSQTIATDVQDSTNIQSDLRETLPDEFSLYDENLSRKFGRVFGRKEGARFGQREMYIARVTEKQGATLWSFRVGQDEDPGDAPTRPTLV